MDLFFYVHPTDFDGWIDGEPTELYLGVQCPLVVVVVVVVN